MALDPPECPYDLPHAQRLGLGGRATDVARGGMAVDDQHRVIRDQPARHTVHPLRM